MTCEDHPFSHSRVPRKADHRLPPFLAPPFSLAAYFPLPSWPSAMDSSSKWCVLMSSHSVLVVCLLTQRSSCSQSQINTLVYFLNLSSNAYAFAGGHLGSKHTYLSPAPWAWGVWTLIHLLLGAFVIYGFTEKGKALSEQPGPLLDRHRPRHD